MAAVWAAGPLSMMQRRVLRVLRSSTSPPIKFPSLFLWFSSLFFKENKRENIMIFSLIFSYIFFSIIFSLSPKLKKIIFHMIFFPFLSIFQEPNIAEGNTPIKVLLHKCKVWSDWKELREFGIFPENWLFSKIKKYQAFPLWPTIGQPSREWFVWVVNIEHIRLSICTQKRNGPLKHLIGSHLTSSREKKVVVLNPPNSLSSYLQQ